MPTGCWRATFVRLVIPITNNVYVRFLGTIGDGSMKELDMAGARDLPSSYSLGPMT